MIQQVHREAQGVIHEAHGALKRETREVGWKLKGKRLNKQSNKLRKRNIKKKSDDETSNMVHQQHLIGPSQKLKAGHRRRY